MALVVLLACWVVLEEPEVLEELEPLLLVVLMPSLVFSAT